MVIDTARAAADLLGPPIADAEEERLLVAYLGAERQVIRVQANAGRRADVDVAAGEILRQALRSGAAGLILAHNHPSGDPTPSPADIAATRRLAEAAMRLDLLLHDHLVFAGNECRSFRALGLL